MFFTKPPVERDIKDMTTGSETVERALSLLHYFSKDRPGIGLSRLARESGINKATTLRYLIALQSAGFIEQDNESAKYFLGPAFHKYARVRKASGAFPRMIEVVLNDLAGLTNETSHISRLSGSVLETIDLVESTRSARVILPYGEALPLHASASGLAVLAWPPAGLFDALNRTGLHAFTKYTMTSKAKLHKYLEQVRKRGVARGFQGFELDVVGIAAPYFDEDGTALGAVAVAMPVSRSSIEREAAISKAVLSASQSLTTALGGVTPSSFPRLTSDTSSLEEPA